MSASAQGPGQPSKVLARVVAVVGCDGSGKSTLTADLAQQLGGTEPVELVYLGQSSGKIGRWIQGLPIVGPPFSRYLVRKAEKTHVESQVEPSVEPSVEPAPKSPPGAATGAVMFALSLWRAWKFRQMLARHRRGGIFITDRYPQDEFPGFHFDGSGLDVAQAKGWFVRALARRERRLYQWMASYQPALLIRLNIDAETAHARKPDHKMASLRVKTAVFPRIDFHGAKILELDSCKPYPQVLTTALAAAQTVLL